MKKNILSIALGIILLAHGAVASAEPFIGEIRIFAGNFAPQGWAFCDGQVLQIAQNQALFSLLGTIYGGDGEVTFALPDLRGRLPMHAGSGIGLTPRLIGHKGGTEWETLVTAEMPAHTHSGSYALKVSGAEGNSDSPVDNYMAKTGDGRPNYSTSQTATTEHAEQEATGAATGGGFEHNNVPPYQVVHYIIALQGLFPSR